MRGEKTKILLELISKGVVGTVDLFEAFLKSGYGATPGRIRRELAHVEKRKYSGEYSEQEAKQNYYTLLGKLKRDGLTQKKTRGGEKFFILTDRGDRKLEALKTAQPKIHLPSAPYIKEQDNKFVIIAFDIPEKERRKRDWLRFVLRDLGLKMVQKSVWIGKVKIPKEFLEDIHQLKLINFVEIFEVSKTGTLKHLG